MIMLMDDIELYLAGIMFTVPQEFSIVRMQSSCDDADIIVLKSNLTFVKI